MPQAATFQHKPGRSCEDTPFLGRARAKLCREKNLPLRVNDIFGRVDNFHRAEPNGK
jgi:hypothetical protein